MLPQESGRLLWAIAILLLSGLADSQGFVHAASAWREGRAVWPELGRAALGFAFGMGLYLISVRDMARFGIVAPELQTIIWFGVTLVGVALVSGHFFHWPRTEQMVALGVIVGIGWLLVRTNG